MDSSAVETVPRSADFDVDPQKFSAANWLNAVLSTPDPPSLSSLRDEISDSQREAHESLDSALKEAVQAVPWVVRESERIRQRTNALLTNVLGVGERVAGVESSVVSSVKTIADADTVVRRVQDTVSLLETAANAELLLERLESLLASAGADGADLVVAADVVAQLRRALQPLDGVPELADRFAQLSGADARLEKLAAPQLLQALEAHNRQAAINARIVFDQAGRENAFRAQYVSMRGKQVRSLWTKAWAKPIPHDADRGEDVQDTNDRRAFVAGDLASSHAQFALRGFYEALAKLITVEADWLQEAFPDLKDVLLPALICESLADLKEPSLRASVTPSSSAPDAIAAAVAISDRLFSAAMISVNAAAQVARTCLPRTFREIVPELELPLEINSETADIDKTATDNELLKVVPAALSALLVPYRTFWDSLLQVAVCVARKKAEGLQLRSEAALKVTTPVTETVKQIRRRPPLADIAKDIEACAKEVAVILDECLTNVNQRSSGVGIDAMKQTASTVSSILSERFLSMLRLPMDMNKEEEWTRLNGALRLLVATSALKRVWDTRKEAVFAVAVGSATSALELAALVREDPRKTVRQFLTQVENDVAIEAGVVWELVRREDMASRVVSAFENLDSSNDLQALIDTVHRIVYETMFNGVKERLALFSSQELANNDLTEADPSLVGFSSSPLRYATELADYLMTIPQQLEPFVPDDEDAKYATPQSLYTFSKLSRGAEARRVTRGATVNDGDDRTRADDGIFDDVANMSFAGMWIGVLSLGTMELYIERICNLTKLSAQATQQLATDADYISNVVASLGVPPTAEMALVCKLLQCNADTSSFTEAAIGYTSAEHKKLIRRVAAVRGVSVTI